MIKISEDIKKLYIEDSTPIELEVRFKDNAFPTIKGSDVLSEQMTLHESICEEEQLKFGGCNASSFELTVFNLNSGIKGYEIEPVLITNKTEIPLGVFYVETIEKYAGKDYKKLTAYDKMRYFDVDVKDWYDSLAFPISVNNFRDSLCEYVGVEQNEVTLIADNIMLTKELDSSNGINGLSLMKQICEISGVFGRMDRYGKFDYLSLESSMLLPADDLYPANDLYPSAGSGSSENSFNIPTSLMYEHPLVEDFFTSNIDGVIIVDSEGAEYITENKGNPYYIQDNFAIIGQSYDTITQLAIDLAKKISNISYRPVNSSKIKGQPYVECGDFISGEVNGYGFEAYVFQRDLTGIKALRDAYISKGKEILENDMNGVTATLQRLNSSIGKTKVTIEKTEKGLRGEISQSLEESKKYTDNSSSATLESANNYAQEAAQGAMNAANNNTNEKLKSYYTKEENDNQFDATARGFTAQISSAKEELQKYTDSSASSTLNSANEYAQEAANGAMNAAADNTRLQLESYYTKTETELKIEASSKRLSSTISETQSKWDLVSNDGEKNYNGKKINYGFGEPPNGSELLADIDGKYYYLDVSSGIMYQIIKGESGGETRYAIEEQTQLRTIESHTSSEISQISNEIVLKVDENGRIVKVSLRGSEAGTEFKVNADNINLSASDVINLLSGGTINLTGKNIAITSNNFSVTKEGNVTMISANVSGNILTYGTLTIKNVSTNKSAAISSKQTTMSTLLVADSGGRVVLSGDSNNLTDAIVFNCDSRGFVFGGDVQIDGSLYPKDVEAQRLGAIDAYTGFITTNGVKTYEPVQVASDADLKTDVQSLNTQKSSDFIYALNPVEYKYKDGTSNRLHHGFIAQELHDSMKEDWGVYCDANIDTGENGGKAIRYEELIADLVATVQSQNERIKELEKKIGGR